MSNPIIQRELVGTLRMGRAFGLQLVLLLVLLGLVLIKWPSDSLAEQSGAQSQQVLRVFVYGLLALVMLLAPAFPATSIVREREQGTLTLLLNSPMNRWKILFGKLAGVLGFVLLLMVLSLPAAAACFAMGGVDLRSTFGPIYLILGLLALEYAVLGLWVSSRAGSADSALRITYGLVLLLSIISLGPHYFFKESTFPLARHVCNWTRSLSPIPALMEAMGQSGLGSGGIRDRAPLLLQFTIVSLAVSFVLLLLTALRLDQRMFDRPRPAGKVTDERGAMVRGFRRIMYLWFFDPQRRKGLIGPLTNPVLVKEFRSRRFGRAHWMMRIFGLCLIVSLGLMYFASMSSIQRGVAVLGAILVVLQMTLLILMTPSLASGLISGERETGGWQLLQSTPLSAASIIFGKLVSVMWTLLLLLLATLPGYAVLFFIDVGQWVRITMVLVTMVLTALFALLLSATVSSFFKRTAAATTTAYALLVGLVAGTMLFHLGRGSPFAISTVEKVLTVNPLAAALSLIGAPGFEDYHLHWANWYFLVGAIVVCLLVLLARTWRLTRPQ